MVIAKVDGVMEMSRLSQKYLLGDFSKRRLRKEQNKEGIGKGRKRRREGGRREEGRKGKREGVCMLYMHS